MRADVARIWQKRSAGCAAMHVHLFFDGLSQILHNTDPVSGLQSLRRVFVSGLCIKAATVPADQLKTSGAGKRTPTLAAANLECHCHTVSMRGKILQPPMPPSVTAWRMQPTVRADALFVRARDTSHPPVSLAQRFERKHRSRASGVSSNARLARPNIPISG